MAKGKRSMIDKKVLFVSAVDLFVNGGGAQATHAYLDASIDIFGRENVVVMLGTQISIPKEYEDLKYVRVPARSKVKSCIGFLNGSLSRMTDALLSYLRKHRDEYDICIINGSLTGGKTVKKIEKMGIRTMVIFHNYEVEYHRDNRTIISLKGHFLGAIKRAEKLSYMNSSVGIFLTQNDVDLFAEAYGESEAKRVIVGTFDYKNKAKDSVGGVEKKYSIVISGSLITYQTYIGVKDFFENYFDLAKDVIPNLSILIAGRNPSEDILKYQHDNPDRVQIIPNPEDIISLVRQGSIYLCPTCIGGGLKLRAMDGLKSGLPVLAHEVSARGYDYYFGKEYFRAYSDRDSFKKGLMELLAFTERAEQVSELINKEYYEYFGYESGLERFREAVKLM